MNCMHALFGGTAAGLTVVFFLLLSLLSPCIFKNFHLHARLGRQGLVSLLPVISNGYRVPFF